MPTAVTDEPPVPLSRRLLAEGLGAGLLVTVVVGSGIAAERLSPSKKRFPSGSFFENSSSIRTGSIRCPAKTFRGIVCHGPFGNLTGQTGLTGTSFTFD
jgi:hypothetical protein